MDRCDECGASQRQGATCREQWDALLALEFSDPRAGRVHFLTVACYQLQHPDGWRLSEEVRAELIDGLRRVVEDGVAVEEIRRQMGERFEGTTRVTAPEGATRDTASGHGHDPEPRRWSSTVADVGPPDPVAHAERVHAWARDILADLAG